MKKILVLGNAGMAGHVIEDYLVSLNKYKIRTTARNNNYICPNYYVDIENNLNVLKLIIEKDKLDIIINCIGLLAPDCINQLDKSIYINSYFPHWLESITQDTNTRVIHLSTDCVNLGTKGNYSESDIPDEVSNYGRSKAFGEIKNDKDLTIRMSIIGKELKSDGSGLFEWFMKQEGKVGGYSKVMWNGITCLELAKQIDKIINTDLTGLYHLAPDFKISKYNLLKLIAKVFNKNIVVEPNEKLIQDKTLVNNRKDEYDPKIPSYEIQLREMKEWIK